MEHKNQFKIVSDKCVNSKWKPYWLNENKKKDEHCECGFTCKIKVSIEKNGHKPYEYVVTRREFNRLKKELTFINE